MDTDPIQVAIVGGGISGLALGFQLHRSGVRVRVLEASARAGGNLHTELIEGYRCESGPTGVLDNEPATGRLVEALDLASRWIASGPRARTRWVVRDKRLRRLPQRPPELLRSDVLSASGKAALFLEWSRPRRTDPSDESVYDFARRRVGSEAADVLVDALVTGIYAADPRQLSLAATFPKLRAMEIEHGSLLRAARAASRDSEKVSFAPGGTLHSFDEGMEVLPGALRTALGDALSCDARVTQIERARDGWSIGLANGSAVAAPHLVLALPAWHAAPLLEAFDAPLATEVASIPSTPIAVLHLGFEARAVEHVERGFGFLVPNRERFGILGTLFESWVFPNRSPAEHVLWRTLLGGARDRGALDLDDATLVARVRAALKSLLGVQAAPVMTQVVRHARAIPQYRVGHLERIARIEALAAQHPGLHLTGNSYRGISVNACIQGAETLAAKLAAAGDSTVVPP